jgi:[methyl-Co(III) methanol-specific corrinoid protein]:coenzyme M methyltransferase
MQQKQRIINALERKPVDKIPAGLFTTAAPLEIMDSCGAARPEADYDPEKMAELAIATHRITGFETIRYPFDFTVLAENFGCKIHRGSKDVPPAVLEGLEINIEDIEVPEDLMQKGRMPAILEATRILKRQVEDEVPLICGLAGPVDLAVGLIGMEPFLLTILKEPNKIDRLLEVTSRACIKVANESLEAGADIICIAEAVSSPEIVPPYMFNSITKAHYRQLANSINGKCVIHVCGETDPIIKDIAECGFCGVSVEESVEDLQYAIRMAHEGGAALIGNVSTSVTIYNKTTEEVKTEAFKCLEAGVDILAPGCGIAPQSPVKNMQALVEARNEFCREK